MKKTNRKLAIIVLCFAFIQPIFSQDQLIEEPLLAFKSELVYGFSNLPINHEFLAGKSYSWLAEWVPNYHKERFQNGVWMEISNSFKIGLESTIEDAAQLRIFTADGDLIKEENAPIKSGVNRFPIDTTDWEKGGYIIQIQTEQGGILKKIIKV